jgi:uncharacterized membrane protein YfcA
MGVFELLVVFGAIAVGAFIKGAIGSGLPQVAIPVMAVFLGVEHAVIVMAIPGVLANVWLVWSHRHEARNTRDLPGMVLAGIVGAVAGTFLLHSLDGRWLSAALAAVIAVYIVLSLARPAFRIPARVTRYASPPVGLVAGGLQGATGISGPLLTTWLHGFGMKPRAFVFAISTLFFVIGVVQMITLAGVGLYTTELVLQSLLALIPIALTLPLGSAAARRLKPQTFQRVILVLLAASVVSLLHDAFTGGA